MADPRSLVDISETMAAPLGDLIAAVGRGLAAAQQSLDQSTIETLRKYYKPGAIVEETQFTSTSAVQRGGKGFGGNVKYYIKVKTGRDVKPISIYKGEEEILLVPGTKYKVLRVEGEGASMSIYMEEA